MGILISTTANAPDKGDTHYDRYGRDAGTAGLFRVALFLLTTMVLVKSSDACSRRDGCVNDCSGDWICLAAGVNCGCVPPRYAGLSGTAAEEAILEARNSTGYESDDNGDVMWGDSSTRFQYPKLNFLLEESALEATAAQMLPGSFEK